MAEQGQPLSPRTSQPPWFALKIAFVVFLVIYGFACVRKGSWNPPKHTGTDFTAYYSAGELARKGQNIYDHTKSSTPRRPYIYPPMFAVFPMAPLSLLPHDAALAIFYALNAAALLGSMWLLRRILFPADSPAPTYWWQAPEFALACGMLLIGRYWDSNAKLSNANVLVMFLLVLGLYWFQKKRELWGGVVVALAVTFKLTPGLFGIYFLWTRNIKGMLGGALGLLAFLFVLPIFLLGPSLNMDLVKAFWRNAAGHVSGSADESAPPDPSGVEVGWGKAQNAKYDEASSAVGISLRGTFQKVLSPIDALEDHTEHGHPPVGERGRKINIMDLSLAQARLVANVLGLILLGITIALTISRKSWETPFALSLSWSLVTVTMLLISPLTRKAHCVVLLIPAMTLIAGIQLGQIKNGVKKFSIIALVTLLWAGTLTSPDLVGDYWSDVLHSAGCHTLALFLLFMALSLNLWTVQAKKL